MAECAAFLKVMDQEALESSLLKIPPKFMQLYSSRVSREARILGPDNAAWSVSVWGESISSIAFRNGWSDFVVAYGLKAGDFVVVRLVEDSTFRAEIFGSKTLISRCAEPESERQAQAGKLQQQERTGDGLASSKEAAATTGGGTVSSRKRSAGNERRAYKKRKQERLPADNPAMAASRTNARRRAESFIPENGNPCSISEMKTSHVCKGFLMALEARFSRKYLPSTATQMVLLDSSGQSWPARWVRQGSISGGWKKFAVDHAIQKGDFCVFELVNGNKTKPVLKVHIFRVEEHEQCRTMKRTSSPQEQRSQVVDRAQRDTTADSRKGYLAENEQENAAAACQQNSVVEHEQCRAMRRTSSPQEQRSQAVDRAQRDTTADSRKTQQTGYLAENEQENAAAACQQNSVVDLSSLDSDIEDTPWSSKQPNHRRGSHPRALLVDLDTD